MLSPVTGCQSVRYTGEVERCVSSTLLDPSEKPAMSSRPRSLFRLWFTLMLLAGSSFGCSSSTSESPPPTVSSQVNEDVEGKAEVGQLSHIRAIPPLSAALSDELSNLDPAHAGWDSEAFHDAQSKRFKKLGHLLFDAPNPRADALAELLSDDFTCSGLRPEKLIEAFSDRAIVVRRASKDETASVHLQGVSGLLAAAAPLRQLLVDSDERRVKFKTLGVDLTDDSAGTTTVFQASGHSPEEAVQINAIWECTWTREDLPRLVSIDVKDYEEIVPRSTGRVHFGDATEAVLGRNKSFREQLAFGYDHWRSRSSRSLQFDLAGNQGLALGDVNGDGLDDIYMAQSGGLPNRLFLHNSDGTATDISKKAGVDWLDFSRTALLIDLDNDGDQDIALGLSAGVLFLENDGHAHFQLKNAVRCRGSVYALAAADYDNDGDLDIYVCGRYANDADDNETRVSGLPLPYHDANNGGPGTLLRNDIGSSGVAPWQFRDVTIEVGLEVNNRRFTLAAAWEDYDNDGDQDLYLANDFGRNNLYRNDGGKFVDVARSAGVEDIGAGMSASWGDANGDGLVDLYVGNMFSSAGHRITTQSQFMAGVDETTRAEYRRHARGNSLFINRGDGTFDDATMEAGVNLGRWAWGSMFVDINGDGRDDMVVANGFITTKDSGDL